MSAEDLQQDEPPVIDRVQAQDMLVPEFEQQDITATAHVESKTQQEVLLEKTPIKPSARKKLRNNLVWLWGARIHQSDPLANTPDPTGKPINNASLELAYTLTVASINDIERRLDIVEKRLQDLLAFATTITLAVIAACAGKVDMHHWLFYTAMMIFAVASVLGIRIRAYGMIYQVHPRQLQKKFLLLSPEEFKVHFVAGMGIAKDYNVRLLTDKDKRTNVVSVLFLIQLIFLGIWAISLPVSGSILPQSSVTSPLPSLKPQASQYPSPQASSSPVAVPAVVLPPPVSIVPSVAPSVSQKLLMKK